jgi:outer membrane immunogenic protein
MRSVICALALLALPTSAFAGDFDILRGSTATYNWAGFYGGAQAGYSSSVVKFGTAAGPEVSFLLRGTAIEQDEQISDWNVLGTRQPTSLSLGGFAGYNFEWENLILGLELNYNHVSISSSATNSIERSFSDSGGLPSGHNYFYTVNVAGTAAVHLSDVATFRARAGIPEGIFLPYAFVGLAVARVDTSSSATVMDGATDYPDSETPPLTPLQYLCNGTAAFCSSITPQGSPTYTPTGNPLSQANAQNNALAYGVAAGVGVDVGILPNMFLRGELEYVYLAPVNGIQLSFGTARVGAGLKF